MSVPTRGFYAVRTLETGYVICESSVRGVVMLCLYLKKYKSRVLSALHSENSKKCKV